ncbi:DNA polymerase IV [Ligilactobacillus salitolerans]|uniref:DNA polymerase IV n=1 Tax=Ligilactobacillus salitolerans TaxID=1808352 RepID=A0A401ISR2_9LACO|nr:DNA polymerase IV [Ligilactobacillus salitolerans]GBG94568.1 DNA polymerase IV [Ligilactobacillus salitolerans]
MKERKIIHIDMDAFYASIEMRDDPSLVKRPLVIARDPRKTGGHGVVATANYVARSYGIHSAMSSQEALKLCSQAYFKDPDFKKYRAVSSQIHEIFHEYTDKIEPVAFDEAYLDVTENKKQLNSAIDLACMLQQEIYSKVSLTCSAGISYNKFLAKLASDYRKPVGITVVRQDETKEFLFPLPIEKFRGVGKKTVPKMHDLGVFTGKDLYQLTASELIGHFGKMGYVFYHRVRGIDERPVEWQRERKSLGNERTFDQPLTDSLAVDNFLKKSAARLAQELEQRQKHGKTLVLKVRNSAFETTTKRITLDDYLPNETETFEFYGKSLLEQIQDPEHYDIRLLGLTVTNLDPLEYENIVLPLWK